jgi:hypothetical protein
MRCSDSKQLNDLTRGQVLLYCLLVWIHNEGWLRVVDTESSRSSHFVLLQIFWFLDLVRIVIYLVARSNNELLSLDMCNYCLSVRSVE